MRLEVITETECMITKEAVKNSATNIIPKGNVVIAIRVGLGKVAYSVKTPPSTKTFGDCSK